MPIFCKMSKPQGIMTRCAGIFCHFISVFHLIKVQANYFRKFLLSAECISNVNIILYWLLEVFKNVFIGEKFSEISAFLLFKALILNSNCHSRFSSLYTFIYYLLTTYYFNYLSLSFSILFFKGMVRKESK